MGQLRIEKRGKTWQYSFEGAKVNGKRQRITQGGFRTKAEAIEAGTQAHEQYNNGGMSFKPSQMSVTDFFDFWLKEYCEINCKESTISGYKKKIKNHILPTIGRYKLSSVNPATLQSLINNMVLNQFSKNTIISIKGILTKSFKFAVSNGMIKYNPAQDIILPSSRSEKIKLIQHPNSFITDEEVERLLARFPEGSSAYLPLLFGLRCGLRLGEVYALTWDCVDLENGEITINKQVQWSQKDGLWYLSKPKYNEFRTISLDADFHQILIKERNKQIRAQNFYEDSYKTYFLTDNKFISEDNSGNEIDFVLRRDDGGYINARTTQNLSQIAHKQLNIPHFTFHSLRHTHITNMLNKGAPEKYVQARVGHSDIKTTKTIYQHMTKELIASGNSILNTIYN